MAPFESIKVVVTSSEGEIKPEEQLPGKHISYRECISLGGEILDIESGKLCPDGRKFLGIVDDASCNCACCK